MIEIDQTKRHIINVPMPFTREQLTLLVGHYNGWQEDPEIVKCYVDHIIEKGRVDLNPSSSLGEGANIVDTFNTGFVIEMKALYGVDVDPKTLWFHPMCTRILSQVTTFDERSTRMAKNTKFKVELVYDEAEIISNEHVITEAIDANSGHKVKASEICPGNSDDLSKYSD